MNGIQTIPIIATFVLLLAFPPSMAQSYANTSNLEVIYSPDVIDYMAGIIADTPEPDITEYGEKTVKTTTTISSVGDVHGIEYNVYVDEIYDKEQSIKFTVAVITEDIYRITDNEKDVLVTANSYHRADSTYRVNENWECVTSMQVIGHGSSSARACLWQVSGTVSIAPTSGAIGWQGGNTIYKFWIPYYFDEVTVNPWFATNSAYTSNSPGGSLTYSGIYSSFEAYNGRVVFYYSI